MPIQGWCKPETSAVCIRHIRHFECSSYFVPILFPFASNPKLTKPEQRGLLYSSKYEGEPFAITRHARILYSCAMLGRRRTHHKSRAGCVTCKRKKIKVRVELFAVVQYNIMGRPWTLGICLCCLTGHRSLHIRENPQPSSFALCDSCARSRSRDARQFLL